QAHSGPRRASPRQLRWLDRRPRAGRPRTPIGVAAAPRARAPRARWPSLPSCRAPSEHRAPARASREGSARAALLARETGARLLASRERSAAICFSDLRQLLGGRSVSSCRSRPSPPVPAAHRNAPKIGAIVSVPLFVRIQNARSCARRVQSRFPFLPSTSLIHFIVLRGAALFGGLNTPAR